jgi:hypothetical protein
MIARRRCVFQSGPSKSPARISQHKSYEGSTNNAPVRLLGNGVQRTNEGSPRTVDIAPTRISSDQLIGDRAMNQNIDVYVCSPDVGINKSLEAVFLVFEVMDRETQEGTGKSHTVGMPMLDAMQLLRNLQHVQQQFSLPAAAQDPVMVELPQKKN